MGFPLLKSDARHGWGDPRPFFSSRRRHTRLQGDWSSDVCSSDLYLHSSGGKRLRPALLLLSAKFAGATMGPDSTAIQLGAVVELIHAATLVHDDVIDAAETRRGRPSTNV